MDGQDGSGYGSGQRTYTVDRRTETVSGSKGYGVEGSNQIGGTGDLSSGKPSWGFNDAEMKRKKRIARYKAYTVEGKVKSTLKKGFRWIRHKCCEIAHGF